MIFWNGWIGLWISSPIEKTLQATYPATTGRPPCAPLTLFKVSLLQYCYGLSDPQCEELVADRMSWRRSVDLGLQDKVSDETMLVRQRLMEHGLHEKLLALVNGQLEKKPHLQNLSSPCSPEFFECAPVADSRAVNALLVELDRGEAEAIVLAKEKHAVLLIDEIEGRDVAARERVQFIGLLGVLAQAKLAGIIPSVRNVLNQN